MKKTFPGSADSGKVPAKIITIAGGPFIIEDDSGWVPPLQLLKIKNFVVDFTETSPVSAR
jgi:hypothetical protein